MFSKSVKKHSSMSERVSSISHGKDINILFDRKPDFLMINFQTKEKKNDRKREVCNEYPGIPFSIINAVIPFDPAVMSVLT